MFFSYRQKAAAYAGDQKFDPAMYVGAYCSTTAV